MSSFSSRTNWMTLYELDPGDEDELVQSACFPQVIVNLTCDIPGCSAAGSNWVAPSYYASPSSPAKVDARLAMAAGSAWFSDPYGDCEEMAGMIRATTATEHRSKRAANRRHNSPCRSRRGLLRSRYANVVCAYRDLRSAG